MIKNLRLLWNKYIKYRNVELTPKGECFKAYCTDIVNEKLTNEIFHYESMIDDMIFTLKKDYDMNFNRKEMAEFILEAYEIIS